MSIRFNKKVLRYTSIGVVTLIISTASILGGCTVQETSPQIEEPVENNEPAVLPEDSQESIMIDFEQLVKNYSGVDKVVEFVNDNISKVSKDNAAYMILELEKAQKEYFTTLEEKFYGEGIQEKIYEIILPDFTLPDIEKIPEGYDVVKALLQETKDNGYRVETAEGMYFPIISYEFYRQYRPYVQEDIVDYIDVMSVESNHVPAKDGALVIEWDELLNRALGQEVNFIEKHKSSVKIDDVRELNKKYITFILYGLNNTPLFSYDDNIMVQEAKEAYLEFIERNKESELLDMVKEYMEILAKTDYKLSEEADLFRKDILSQ